MTLQQGGTLKTLDSLKDPIHLQGHIKHVLSRVQLFATPWTVALQAPVHSHFPGKDTGVGCLFLLQGIFPTQGSNLHLLPLLPRRQILYRLSLRGNVKARPTGGCVRPGAVCANYRFRILLR